MEDQYYEVSDNAWQAAEIEEDILSNKFFEFSPKDAAEEYYYFREYIGQLNFIWLKRDFITDTMGINNPDYINGAIIELESIIKDPLTCSDTFKKEAIDYVVSVYAKKNEAMDCAVNDTLKVLYVYTFLKINYFNDVVVPQEAFEFVDSPIDFTIFGITYARYFLFYDYLKSLIAIGDKVVVNTPPKTVVNLTKSKKVEEMKKQHLRDIWKEDKIVYFNKIIQELKLTRILDVPCIRQEGEELIWSKDIGKGSKSYLAGFFYACETANLLDSSKYEGSIPVIIAILKKTFQVYSTPSTYNLIKFSKNTDSIMYKNFFKQLISRVLKEQ